MEGMCRGRGAPDDACAFSLLKICGDECGACV